jgi:tetratricopeptide (TPR) repeat protein
MNVLVLALAGVITLPAAAQKSVTPVVLTAEQLAQQGAGMIPAEADELEQRLAQNPHDLNARSRLLGYYFYQWMTVGEENAKAARARHVHWLISNHPESSAVAIYEAIIDPRGHQLADEAAYNKTRDLWTAAAAARPDSAAVQGNMAKFFQLNDKDLAEKALHKAIALEPNNNEWQWRLGYLYALGILGVDGLAFNGQPTSVDPQARNSPFAVKARKALDSAGHPLLLAVAGNTLYRYGSMLAPTAKGRLEAVEDAEKLFRKAQTLEPNNPTWSQLLQQLQGMKHQMTAPAK